MEAANEYFDVVLNIIYDTLKNMYDSNNLFQKFDEYSIFYPNVVKQFKEWLEKYSDLNRDEHLKNKVIYTLSEKDYYKAIIDFIAGMTDNFAINVYEEIVRF